MDKDTLRTEAIRHRDFIDPLDDNPEEAVALFFEHIKPQKDQVVAGYWPKGKEFDSRPIFDDVMQAGCFGCLPLVEKGSRVLKFSQWQEGDALTEGTYGILEPSQKEFITPDILLIPLLAFDRHGYRLGYGGGYYDATLAKLRAEKDILAVGVGYSTQAVLFNLPREEHDQALDWIITPKSAQEFRK